jgi:hypothetical protein
VNTHLLFQTNGLVYAATVKEAWEDLSIHIRSNAHLAVDDSGKVWKDKYGLYSPTCVTTEEVSRCVNELHLKATRAFHDQED